MIKIEDRLSNYEKQLNDTLAGFLESIEKEQDIERLQEFKNHITNIEKIKDFGIKEYNALSQFPSINYFADNYKSMPKGLFDSYAESFGIELDDEIYNTIKSENDKETVRNMIWKECFGMDYDLIPQFESISREEEVLSQTDLSPEEREIKMVQIMCTSGYRGKNYCNPTYIKDMDQLKIALEEIRKEAVKSFK